MKLSLYAGIALAMPVILWQVWRFVTPGLYPHEKRYAIPFLVSALALFVLGAGLAYYTLPRALEFLVDIGGTDNFVDGVLARQVLHADHLHDAGVRDRLRVPDPADLHADGRASSTPRSSRRVRRYAIVGICVLVAVITPSGDPISMLMLSVPMVHLLRGRDHHRPDHGAAQAVGRPGLMGPELPATTSRSTRSSSGRSPPSTTGRSVLVAAPTGSGQDGRGRARRRQGAGRGQQGLLHGADQGAVEPEVRRPRPPPRPRAGRPPHRRQRHQRRRAGGGDDHRGAPQHDLRGVTGAARACATSCSTRCTSSRTPTAARCGRR